MTASTKQVQTEPSSKLAVLIGPSFRRMVANEEFQKGVRTIWHRGRINTDMLTWENKKGVIEQQELTFAYLVVQYSQSKGLQTGKIPCDFETESISGHAKSEMVDYDAEISMETLHNAHSLLAHCPQRDFYGQHLMETIAAELVSQGSPPASPTFDASTDARPNIDASSTADRALRRSSPIPPTAWILFAVAVAALVAALYFL